MMRLAVVQFRPALHAVHENLEFMVRTASDTDAHMIVFPELATSGYFFLSRDEVRVVAEPLTGPSITALRDVAERMDRVIVVGFPELDGDVVYNSAAIIVPGQEPRAYRKTHLFYKERHCFAEGNSGFFVVNIPRLDCNLGTMICYDWRFPEAARTLALRGADLIVCPSNLVTNVSHISMPSRALENKVYLAVANRTGTETRGDEELLFNGASAIYGFNGQRMAEADDHSDAVLITDIDPAATRKKSFNSINDIFADRRPEFYA
ncbi:MAG: carbon-nitrogen hydrolase [Candidatus Kapabacteria bacterium]|nr:carbon-nitrogen hydrolase [Candidatus Kapabacteria bacterium]